MYHSTDNPNPTRRPVRTATTVALAGLLGLLSVAGASAASLLSNGEFSNFTTSPWIASQGTLYLSNLDRQNNSGSGSARLAHPSSFIGSLLISECVQISGGSAADVGGYFRTAASNTAGSKMRIGRIYYSDNACKTYISEANSAYGPAPSAWTLVSNAHTAPTSARSVKMTISAVSTTANEAFDLVADGLFLNSTGGTQPSVIFKDGFEGGSTASWGSIQ